jgi:hypothetical protein
MKKSSTEGIQMKKTILATILLLASMSQADMIKCSFTEPFIMTTYSTSKSELTYEGADLKKFSVKNVSFQIKSAGVFELVSKDGKVLQSLTLNNKGSNGMSDTIYPFEVKDNTSIMTANGGFGGCISNHLQSKEGNP